MINVHDPSKTLHVATPVVRADQARAETAPTVSASPSQPTNHKKIIGGVIGLAMLVILAGAGILIAQRQQWLGGPLAPNAPTSQPSADAGDLCTTCCQAITVRALECDEPCTADSQCADGFSCVEADGQNVCKNTTNCPAPIAQVIEEEIQEEEYANTVETQTGATQGSIRCVSKEIFTEYVANNGAIYTENTPTLPRGSTFVYRLGVLATQATNEMVILTDQLNLAGLEWVGSPDPQTVSYQNGVVTMLFDSLQAGQPAYAEFKVQIKDTAPAGTITNNQVLLQFGETSFGLQGIDCQASIVVASAPTTAVTAFTNSTNPGCNQVCINNSDCADPNHICSTISSGSAVCRLASNPTNESCSSTNTIATDTLTGTNNEVIVPTQPSHITQQQPSPTAELPQAGPENWGDWLKAGLLVLGLGAILLLLL